MIAFAVISRLLSQSQKCSQGTHNRPGISPRHGADPTRRSVPAPPMPMACLLMPRSSPRRSPEESDRTCRRGPQHIQLPCVLDERPLFTASSGGAGGFRRQEEGPKASAGGGGTPAEWTAPGNLLCETHSGGDGPDVAARMSSLSLDRGRVTSVMSSCSPASAGAPSRGSRS